MVDIFRAKDLDENIVQDSAWEKREFRFFIFFSGEYSGERYSKKNARKCLEFLIKGIQNEAIEGRECKLNNREISFEKGISLIRSLARKSRLLSVNIVYDSTHDSSFTLKFHKQTCRDRPDTLEFLFYPIGGY